MGKFTNEEERGHQKWRKKIIEGMFYPAICYEELQRDASLLNKGALQSLQDADLACDKAIYSPKDLVLRAKAYRAFAACYKDLGMENKAAEMTSKWQAIANENLEP